MTSDPFSIGRVLLSDVVPTHVEWLWAGRIPLGKITMLEGDPGTGKSTLTLEIAARVSKGEALPGGEPNEPRGVVLWTAEDDLADTVAPRLAAAGADMSRIGSREFVTGERWECRPPTLDDEEALRADIVRVDAALVVIDPLVAFIPSGTNIYNDLEVRQVLARLAKLAEGMGVAVVLVRHLHKRARGNPIYAGGGSIGFAGAARSVLLCAKDPDDATGKRRVLAWSKGNLSEEAPALAFRLETEDKVGRVVWDGETHHSAAWLLWGANHLQPAPGDAAREFLSGFLAHGSQPSLDVLAAAAAAGISEGTLRRAAKGLGIRPDRDGFGRGSVVYWALPGAGADHTSP